MPAKILVIEDDQSVREAMVYNLKQEGYAVVSASDGEKGYALIRSELPDLVILDIMLPKLDGLAICRMVRKNPDIAATPIIMLSARGTQGDKMVGLDSGADDYVTKPFDLGELLARIRAVMRRTSVAGQDRDHLAAGPVRLDLAMRQAFLNDREIRLSVKEFDLLAELLRNRGAVLSRDLILSRIWGYDYYGDSRTVDVHIRWLRQKIEEDPSDPRHILTVRGIGYRFQE